MAGGALALLLGTLLLVAGQATAMSWRLFAGREECITEYMPDYQWEMVKHKEQTPEHTHVLIDLGFVITSRYGTEANKAAVDFNVYGPNGDSVHKEESVSETEIAVTAEGGRGPWRACYRVSKGQILRPSVIVKLTYFTVNSMSLVGTSFEWQRDAAPAGPAPATIDASSLGTVEQVQEVTSGLQRLDHYLMNVTNEQRYLYARTVRHLRTAESTHGRTLGYMLLICGTIVAASFVQVLGVRMMFNSKRKHGLII
ncbi:transmembrane emp24 domain-containing p24beta3-like [Micractinium conductrix]|uniref:Transmembrane emp24 domain-containing p24beta3-like n=1 Tax=Micractinium conductrix TaxID=554055 RepID=A0A2P6V8T3_9CHLO|nr:transmembrane emp24 domain-containing p24beta3-like [Micractinium conductrix]|eukprot:PSC70489.1 transmembrane emp24 domain-containing p24beta3-like [Micractinium conductrix]